MDHYYQQFDLQKLIDLLAEETEKYTKAFISGKGSEMADHREVMHALMAEINRRKKEEPLPPDVNIPLPPEDVSSSGS